jgi:hypothetical protein
MPLVVDPDAKRQVRIVSNGLRVNTTVYVGDEELKNVTRVEWELDAVTGLSTAIIHVMDAALEAESEMELVTSG